MVAAADRFDEPVNNSAPPENEAIDSATTLKTLRGFESSILASMNRHEEALTRLRLRYQRVRAKLYREHKKEVILEDNKKLQRFQQGCPKPKAGASKEELDAQARCLQNEAKVIDDSDLGRLMQQHLWTEPKAPAECQPFRQIDVPQLRPEVRACLAQTGDARWTADGLADANESSAHCGRQWVSTSQLRCMLQGKDLLFMGNSVVRRQMYTVL